MTELSTRGLLPGPSGGRSRAEALLRRLEEVASLVEDQQERLERHRQRLDAQRDRLDSHRDRLDELEEKVTTMEVVWSRLEHQVAALEARAGDEAADRGRLVATETEMTEARRLLDEVRDEHARIRVRFQVVTRYEERVRRLEKALDPAPDA